MTIQERLDSDQIIYDRFGKDEWREGTVDEFEKDYPFLKCYINNINWYSNNVRVAILKSLHTDKVYHLYMFSEKHRYSINVSPTYIGAFYTCLYNLPMEDWHRGNDMPDGKSDEHTFRRILFAILATELVPYDDGSKPPVHIAEDNPEEVIENCM